MLLISEPRLQPSPRVHLHYLILKPLRFFILFISILSAEGATAGADISAIASTMSCSHPSALEARHAIILHTSRARSSLECVSMCLRRSMCAAVAHVWRKNDKAASSSCVFFGGISRNSSSVVIEESGQNECSMHILNPCPVGATVFRGYCRCAPGTTGQFCQLTNPGDCSSSWDKIYSSSGNPSNLSDVIRANKNSQGGYVKVALDQSDGSVLVLHGMYFFSDASTTFAAQVTPTLSRKSWEEFDDEPALEFRFVRYDGRIEMFTDTSNTKETSTAVADWFMRWPHVTRLLYQYDSGGQAVSGSVDDVIQGVRKGQTVVTYNAAHVITAQNKVQLTRYHWEVSRKKGYYNFQTNSYWLNSMGSTGNY
ncbi:hypothetical protein ACOMHN_000598 [Nucella lapillus]